MLQKYPSVDAQKTHSRCLPHQKYGGGTSALKVKIEGWVNFNDTVDVVMVDGSAGTLLWVGVEKLIALSAALVQYSVCSTSNS